MRKREGEKENGCAKDRMKMNKSEQVMVGRDRKRNDDR